MPYSYVDYGTGNSQLTGDQLNGIFTPTLDYLDTADIYVTVTKYDTGLATELSSGQFTVATTPQLTITLLGPPSILPLSANDYVRVGRKTDVDQLARTYSDGSVLKASDINSQNNQFLYSIQESLDTGGGALPINTGDQFDAGGRRIENVGEPVNAQDVATKSYVIGQALYNGAELPQSWSFTTSAGDIVGTHREYALNTPTPASNIDDLYLVEVDGVMQVPRTDYEVLVTGEVYKLRLLSGAGNVQNGVQVAVRNFGTRRQVLSTPFISDGTNAALRVKAQTSQLVDLVSVLDPLDNPLYRIDYNGEMLLGDGVQNDQFVTKIGKTDFQLGKIDTTPSQSVENDEYGFKVQLASNQANVEMQGISANPASTDPAISVYRLSTDGSVTTALKATYGGALVLAGSLNAQGVITTTLNVSGASTISGDIQITAGNEIAFGASGVEIGEDGLNLTQRIKLENYSAGINDGDAGLIPTGNQSAAILFNSSGYPLMGHGGDGSGGVAHGGPGSIYFTADDTSRRAGPHIKVQPDSVQVLGFKIPSDQGGFAATGEFDDKPATLHIGSTNDVLDWPNAALNQVVTKKDIDARIVATTGGDFTLFHPNSFTANATVAAPVQLVDVHHTPNGGLGWDVINDWYSITQGIWILRWEGVTSSPTSASYGVIRVQHIISANPPTTPVATSGDGSNTWANLNDGYWQTFTSGSANGSFECAVGLYDPTGTITPGAGNPPLNDPNYHVRIIAYSNLSDEFTFSRNRISLRRIR